MASVYQKTLPRRLSKTKEVHAICLEPQASLSSLENGLARLAPSSGWTMVLKLVSGLPGLHTGLCLSLGMSSHCLRLISLGDRWQSAIS